MKLSRFLKIIIWHIVLLKNKNKMTALPEQQKESINFEDHAYQRPTNKDYKYATQEKSCGFHFMFLEEESECSF